MRVLCIAIGNTLRGDDGVAHCIAQQIEREDGVVVLDVFQLAPELALEVAESEIAIFIDADIDARAAVIEPLEPEAQGTPLLHSMSPREIVWLASHLYGFRGRAYVVRVPVESFEDGEGLTAVAEAGARESLVLLEQLMRERVRVQLEGAVQGVGFRPFVYRVANELGLSGWVRNSPAGLTVEVEGGGAEVRRFLERVEHERPSPAVVLSSREREPDA